MTRRTLTGVLVALALAGPTGCVHFEPRPITAPANLAAVEARTLDAPELGAFLEANKEVAAWPPPAWTIQTLTLAAFYYHPDLDVARASWGAARAGVITAGARPNPDLGFAPGYNSTTPASLITPWILTLNLDFTIETAGKRGHRIAEARQLSNAARLDIATTAWRVHSRVRQSLVDLYAATERARLLDATLAIQESIVTLLERQLAAGDISPFELAQARLTRDQIRLSQHDAARQEAEARVQLASAVGVTAHAMEGVPLDLTALEGAGAHDGRATVRPVH